MTNQVTLEVVRNTETIAGCNACGTRCYEFDPRKSGPECVTWSQPSMLLDLRVGRNGFTTLLKLCEPCLGELSRRIEAALPVPRVQGTEQVRWEKQP